MLKMVLVVFALLACVRCFVALDAQEKKPTLTFTGTLATMESRLITFKCQTVRDVIPSGGMPCGGADNIKEILFTGGDWSKVLICVDNADPKTKSTKCIIGDAIISLPVKD